MASYRFLEFELSEEDFTLSRGGQRIALEPKALRVLTLLVSRGGHLVDKQELLSSVWPNTFVEESTLTRTIGILRRELGDSSRDSRIIETVPTRGYRFIAPVEILPQSSQLDSMIASVEKGTKTNPAPSVRVGPATFLLMALCAVAIITLGANFLIHRANGKHGAQAEHHVTEQRVTSNSPEAPVDFAVISPDGKFVAYSDPTGLYLRVIASGETPPLGPAQRLHCQTQQLVPGWNASTRDAVGGNTTDTQLMEAFAARCRSAKAHRQCSLRLGVPGWDPDCFRFVPSFVGKRALGYGR